VASTAILFSPTDVAHVLERLPTLSSRLPDPKREGAVSDAFPALRKTTREVYRWIVDTHYQHLAEVVDALERVLSAGCSFDGFLRTRSRAQFVGHVAELLLAEDLLRRGYPVTTVPRSSQVSPDLQADVDGIDVAIEVYSPRELAAVDDWVEELKDLVNQIDLPTDYNSSVATKLEQSIPPPRTPFDPWAPAKILAQTRTEVIAAIQHDVDASLRELQPMSKTYRHGESSLLTTVELANVRRAVNRGPVRSGSFSYPGFSGYSPAGVFRTIVQRALNKARRRQAHGVPAAARVLVVYMMGTKIAEDLVHPGHMEEAKAKLDGTDPQRFGLDAIAFVVRAQPRGLAFLFAVGDDTTLTTAQVEAMFGASA
jgi:hypothetical protein